MPHARSRLFAFTASSALSLVVATSPVVAEEMDDQAPPAGDVTLYTSVTQDTVDAVLAALAEVDPGLSVEVFRAPTGELDARIASEQRTGGIGADVLWMTDPLSVQQYEADGLLAPLEGEAFEAVPDAFKGDSFVGTRLLNLVLVAGADVEPKPTAWADLTDPAYADGVVMPDPGFAGSAFAALGYLGYQRRLRYGVLPAAEGQRRGHRGFPGRHADRRGRGDLRCRHHARSDRSCQHRQGRAHRDDLARLRARSRSSARRRSMADSDDPAAAAAFQAFLVSPEGQAAIASTGWQPVRDDVEWPYDGEVVTADWNELYGSQAQLLAEFYAIFGD